MYTWRIVSVFLVCLMLALSGFFVASGCAETETTSPATGTTSPATEKPIPGTGYYAILPVPVGTSLDLVIEFNSGYPEQVNARWEAEVTVLEVIRGEEAWQRIQAVDSSSQPPQPGFDYILALIRIQLDEVFDSTKAGYQLGPSRFIPMSCYYWVEYGKEYYRYTYYTPPALLPVVPPQPELRHIIKSSEPYEGWIVFEFPEDEDEPLVNFAKCATSFNLGYRGGFFKLYY